MTAASSITQNAMQQGNTDVLPSFSVPLDRITDVRLANDTISDLPFDQLASKCDGFMAILAEHMEGAVVLTGMDLKSIPPEFQPENTAGITLAIIRLPSGNWRPTFEFHARDGRISPLLFPSRIAYENHAVVDALDEQVATMSLRNRQVAPGQGERWMRQRTHG